MARLSNRLSLVSSLALIASAGLAQAADMPAAPAPMYSAVPAANWSGFYAGTVVGYGWTDAEAAPTGVATALDGSFDGATSGAVVGFNWQSSNWVFGLEGDITLHEIRGDVSNPSVPGTSLGVDTLYSARLRGRVGYDFGRFLPYVAGGLSAGESYVRFNGGGVPDFFGDNQRTVGWNVGAGVDVKLGETFIGPLILRAEYIYEDFGDETFTLSGSSFDVNSSTHFARIGIISYLGDDSTPAFTGEMVDWSGAYGGLVAGYSRHNVTTSAAGLSDELEADGALGGIYTGRNFQFGNFVVGWEGSIALTEIEGSAPFFVGGNELNYRANIQADARGRIGYAFRRVLPFVSAGVLWTRSEQDLDGTFPQRGRLPAVAWTVGAGADYRVSDNWSLRGEYTYARDDDAKTMNLAGEEQELEIHQVRFGAAYHF